ncbi:conserved exported hypothetical protein [Rubrivivax sp. A210]|uniref:hypothetical protein n=1 Tax=Rubrivivax sp. A210 TaxID=2772301 RepID=UPI00199793F9|nr:hypothetical protein [Rubrivivax sp. A210]CAD5375246.1 conserved exported hypothetical protein [Rubrivivax sp. A210]
MRCPVRPVTLAALALASLLAGCDQLGIESAAAVAAKREAEGKAIGAGCRHAGRSVEECYDGNKRADKASVFAGWKEMNEYMRENKMESAPRAAPPPPTPTEHAADGEEGKDGAKAEGKADGKGAAKPAAKAAAAKH